MSKILMLLQGVPASGKTGFAREFVKGKTDWVIVSRDAFREARGDYWIPEQENYISVLEDTAVYSAMASGYNIIIDAMNLNPKTVSKWTLVADKHGYELQIKTFNVPLHVAIERDIKRGSKVGSKVIREIYAKYFPEEFSVYQQRYMKTPNEFLPNCIVCDLDGTLALSDGRSPYDGTKVDEDKVNFQLLWVLEELAKNTTIIFVSGREATDICRTKTEEWLNKHCSFKFALFMRNKDDRRKDAVVKEEIYKNKIEPNYNVRLVFDDRNQVVDKWRQLGLLCAQVYYGDF